ncbi:hypothetical protein HKD37_16G045280 [Glycine soja]
MRKEMASRKLSTKRSRKDATGEGSNVTQPVDMNFDRNRFRSAEHQQLFESIKGWSFLSERRVQLRDDEFPDFQEEVARRHWAPLVTPMAKFDPEIVMEFYANAWPTVEGARDMRSWDFAWTAAGRWVRIMHTSMTMLTQIKMTLLLSNILPSDHNSDLPLPKCQLVYAILAYMSIHVAELIADAIYQFVGTAPTRHPVDPEKSNKALGFHALITGLY